MKILIIARGIPYCNSPLHGIFEFDQAKALMKQGNEVVFFAIDLRSLRWKRKHGVLHQIVEGVDCYTFSFPLGAVPNSLLCYIGKFGLEILYKTAFNKERKPDIIHAHFAEQSYMASFISDKYNIPLVITEHSSKFMNNNHSYVEIALKAYGKADCVIAVSKALSEKIKHVASVETEIIPNIVNTSLFKPKLKKTHDGYAFISIGRLVASKRMDLLIQAFSMVNKRMAHCHLDIFGDGPERKNLELLIDSLNLADHVILHGAVDRSTLAEKLMDSDCFVLLSDNETFGVVFIEALAAGVPVISTRCGGPEEIINEQLGVLIDKDSIEEATIAMTNMVSCQGLYDSNYLSQFIDRQYSEKTVAKQLELLYSRIISDN